MAVNNDNSQMRRIEEIQERLEQLPKGTLTYKTIKGNLQPYLQRTENGKSISVYVKKEGREEVLALVEERKRLQDELEYLRVYQEKIAAILVNNPYMVNQPLIGYQKFDEIIEGNMLYVDKTHFIKEWWESGVQVSLITRPRRFGKTLMLSTVECFFSTRYKDRKDLFEKLSIWKEEKYRRLQGTKPVIFMTFAAVKSNNVEETVSVICEYLYGLFNEHSYLIEDDVLSADKKEKYRQCINGILNKDITVCVSAIHTLCELMYHYFGQKVIILIDEYDTPLQEAYMKGYWNEMNGFIRGMFNSALKSNQYMDKALLTGITRVSKESFFSDLNNIYTYSITSNKYADSFGYTKQEVADCLQCQDIKEWDLVKEWYDGYTFGGITDIYNPWSINCYMKERKCQLYWANTGGYGLVSQLIIQGANGVKEEFGRLLQGESIHKVIDENIAFNELDNSVDAVWSLLLAAGYLKADNVTFDGFMECDLSITNKETRVLFQKMVNSWFGKIHVEYNGFCKALLDGDVELMNEYMNYIVMDMISVFDVGRRPSEKAPERFYHGLVLGLIVDLRKDYVIKSNRESGYGRYDILMIPKRTDLDGIIIEFKVRNEKKEESIGNTLVSALKQIEEKQYDRELINGGVPDNRIRTYGFAFEGKNVLIGSAGSNC